MRQTFLIPVEGEEAEVDKWVIYRPLLGLAFVGNRAMAELAMQYAVNDLPSPGPLDEATRFLESVGFFLPDQTPSDTADVSTTAVLLLTNRCQLRCVYCYAAAGAHQENVLDLQTAKTVIDHVYQQAVEHGKKEFKVEFHGGGEPTLEWDLVRQTVEYARSLSLPCKISITSNAIWSRKQCEWLIHNMDGISISMDGDDHTQDHNRPLLSGKPSSSIVRRNLKQLDEHGYQYGIRLTAVEPWENLADNIRAIAETTSCRNVQVEPAFQPGRGYHGTPNQQECQDFVDAFQEAYLVGYERQLQLRYAGARPGMITNRFCSAPYNAVVVNPNDHIVACYEVVNLQHQLEEPSLFGQVRDGTVSLFPGRRENLHRLMQERLDGCASCYCRWSCAGDCYVRTFQPGPDGHRQYGHRCFLNRELTLFLLLHLISTNGGVWRSFKTVQIPQVRPHA